MFVSSLRRNINVLNSSRATKKILLTTEKDYMRLSDQISELSYLEIVTDLLVDQKKFDDEIKSYCND